MKAPCTIIDPEIVALRKESVDRNMHRVNTTVGAAVVALRKESVDRNYSQPPGLQGAVCRSPQGERG